LLVREVSIDPDPPDLLPLEQTGRHLDYHEDHAVGLSMILSYMKDRHPDGQCRILEVGGGIHPQSAALMAHGSEVISIDISFAMSQLGQLFFDHVAWDKKRNISFIACDAHDPPFAEATFDGIVIFAALHHFAEPQRLLANLRRVLKPDGFIAVMCEPCHPDRHDAIYLRDLSKGINEQCWSVEEYAEIFSLAGLKLASGQLDEGSLKAILVAR
jgi:ubiquinone/menaquinone biosynthesis C-methylase UbiE